MPNPFTLQPVSGSDFYDRSHEIESLLERKSHTLIISARRLGKTSLLKELERRITDETPHICLYLTTEVFRDISGMRQWFIRECCGINKRIAFQSLGINENLWRSNTDFFEMLRQIGDRLCNEGLLLYILVDEVNVLADFTDDFLEEMWHSFHGCQEIKWVFSGSQNSYILRDMKKPWLGDSFLTAFASLTLRNLSDEAANQLIRQSQSGNPLEVDDDVVEDIRKLTFNQPYLIHLLCFELYRDGVLEPVTEHAKEETLKQCIYNNYFRDSFDKLSSWIQKLILLEVSEQISVAENDLRKFANRWAQSEQNIKKAVAELVDLCYLKRIGNKLMVSSYFLQRWLEIERPDLKRAIQKNGQNRSGQRMNSIFISYRRDDSADITGRIYEKLTQRFGNKAIYIDIDLDSTPLGIDFRALIDEKVRQCGIMLAVIGTKWLNLKDSKGERRLDDPKDLVRIEIETALKRGIPVIPLLVSGAKFLSESNLPSPLKELTFRNGIPIRSDPDFHKDVDRLITSIEKHLKLQ
ncbi:MAG: TIR domain-containing protein [Candidatus Hodarchaeota archaeon]